VTGAVATREFAVAASAHPVVGEATGEVVGRLLEELRAPPGLLVVLATPAIGGALEDVVGTLRAILQPQALVGAVAEPLWSVDERGPAPGAVLAVLAAPTTPLDRRAIPSDEEPPGQPRPGRSGDPADLLVLADPSTADLSGWGRHLHQATSPAGAQGHLVLVALSRGRGTSRVRLVLDDRLLGGGAVALTLEGGTLVDPSEPAGVGAALWVPPAGRRRLLRPPNLDPRVPVLGAASQLLVRQPAAGAPLGWVVGLRRRPGQADNGRGRPLPWAP
jgi:small ligand-binding sensory domain FIST